MFKKVIALALVMALTAAVAIGGTVAYLTDRDSKANVFTVGDVSIRLDEDFEQGATLTPGFDVKKEATITNTGKNDAWVWMTLAVPAALDSDANLGTENVLHWNMPGCFWNGYHNQQKYINSGIAAGYLPEGSSGVADEDSWINKNESVKETINGVDYKVYTFMYKGAIVPGETTNIALSKVYLDAAVDIDPNGDWYKVVAGEATKLSWNSNTNGNPVVYVSAYAAQKEGFSTVEEAVAAYNAQWTTAEGVNNGTEYAAVAESDTTWYDDTAANFTLNTADDLLGFAELVAGGNSFSGKTVTLGADINLAGVTWTPVGQTGATQFLGTFDGNNHTIKNLSVNSSAQTGAHYSSGLFGWLNAATVKNLTVEGATIIGNHNVGVIAGYMETSGCTISNCHVVNATVICNHANGEACGDKAGVIVGHAGNAGVKVVNCSAKNSTVKAGRDAGQVAGAALTANVTGCTATNVNVSANGTCNKESNINNAVIGRVLE